MQATKNNHYTTSPHYITTFATKSISLTRGVVVCKALFRMSHRCGSVAPKNRHIATEKLRKLISVYSTYDVTDTENKGTANIVPLHPPSPSVQTAQPPAPTQTSM